MVLLESDYEHVGPGWKPILRSLDQTIGNVLSNSKTRSACRVLQIKEKFGGLRFYFKTEGLNDDQNAQIWGAVGVAEHLSFKMCEECGKLNVETRAQKNQKFGWTKTLCHQHHELRDGGARLYTMR